MTRFIAWRKTTGVGVVAKTHPVVDTDERKMSILVVNIHFDHVYHSLNYRVEQMTVTDALNKMTPAYVAGMSDRSLLTDTLATVALLSVQTDVDDWLKLITIHERLLAEQLNRKGKVWPLYQT